MLLEPHPQFLECPFLIRSSTSDIDLGRTMFYFPDQLTPFLHFLFHIAISVTMSVTKLIIFLS